MVLDDFQKQYFKLHVDGIQNLTVSFVVDLQLSELNKISVDAAIKAEKSIEQKELESGIKLTFEQKQKYIHSVVNSELITEKVNRKLNEIRELRKGEKR